MIIRQKKVKTLKHISLKVMTMILFSPNQFEELMMQKQTVKAENARSETLEAFHRRSKQRVVNGKVLQAVDHVLLSRPVRMT